MTKAWRSILGTASILTILVAASWDLPLPVGACLFGTGVLLWVGRIALPVHPEPGQPVEPILPPKPSSLELNVPEPLDPVWAERKASAPEDSLARAGDRGTGARRGIRTPTGYPTRS